MTLLSEMMIRSNAVGKIDLDAVCDAVNSLDDPDVRKAVADALRLREPGIYWTIDHGGRLQAAR